MFDVSDDNPWNEEIIKRSKLRDEAETEKLKADIEASKAGVKAKEKEGELK